jgi:long-chain fatty acid transport protein
MRKRFPLPLPARGHRVLGLLALGLLALGAGQALATGFSIYEAGARATALGCAFTATADDGSALFYNAAGLSFQSGRHADLNAIAVVPHFKFAGYLGQGGNLERGISAERTFLVPGAAYTANPGGKLAYGVGVYAPFGLGVEWQDPEQWVGRRISYDVGIQTIYVTPAVSYLLADGLAVAVGADVATQHLKLSKYSPDPQFGTNAIQTTIEGRSNPNVTPSLGLMYRPSPQVSFGAMYHFEKTMVFEDQDATLGNVQGPDDPWATSLIAGLSGSQQTVSSELNLPSMMSVGLAYSPAPTLRLEGNYVRFGWSTFQSLELDFATDALDQAIHFGYEDSWQARFGAEFQASPTVSLMGGYVRDTTPQPLQSISPLLPDSDRNDYSVGMRWHRGSWDLSLSYMAVVGESRTNVVDGEPLRNTTDYPFGTYKASAHLAGIGLRHSF